MTTKNGIAAINPRHPACKAGELLAHPRFTQVSGVHGVHGVQGGAPYCSRKCSRILFGRAAAVFCAALTLVLAAVPGGGQTPRIQVLPAPDPEVLAKVDVSRFPSDGLLHLEPDSESPLTQLKATLFPMTMRDYAFESIAASMKYLKDGTLLYAFQPPDGKPQNFTLKADGSFEGHGISERDALLWLYADRLRELSEQARAWDEKEAEEARARNDHPPTRILYAGQVYTEKDVDVWSPYILGDTNCSLKRVRTRIDRSDKRATVLHEVMHVATNCSGEPGLHRAIQQMAPSLLELLRENPDLVAYLLKKPETAGGAR